MSFQFNNWYFIFLLILPILLSTFVNRKAISIPSIVGYRLDKNFKIYLGDIFLLLSFIMAVIALMRPQNIEKIENNVEGINISLVLDLSESMSQQDISPSRIEAAKSVLEGFVDNRVHDKISLVIFGVNAFPKVPSTLDHNILKEKIREIEIGDIDPAGTNIGGGMAFALSLLKANKGTKVMVVCTDGIDNSGTNLPLQVSKVAKEMGIKIYSIGIGGFSRDIFGRINGIDEKLLKRISKETSGKYFRATSSKDLKKIFYDIDSLEKVDIEDSSMRVDDLFEYFLIPAAIFLLLSLFFNEFLLTRVP